MRSKKLTHSCDSRTCVKNGLAENMTYSRLETKSRETRTRKTAVMYVIGLRNHSVMSNLWAGKNNGTHKGTLVRDINTTNLKLFANGRR
jgi:hypothetical protein